jgi:hypothetical protein
MGNKDAGLRIRVDSELRSRFLDACHSQDMPAAQVLRSFMKDFVFAHAQSQITLKEESKQVAPKDLTGLIEAGPSAK